MTAWGADLGSDREKKWTDTIVLDDNKIIEFDFTKVEKVLLHKTEKGLYELIGINPHRPPGSNGEAK